MPAAKKTKGKPSPSKSTWRAKLDRAGDLPKVVRLDEKQAKRWGGGTCAIPSPREVDSLMRQVPEGRLTTIDQLRTAIACRHGAATGCPITTGIFAWIAAHASAEAAADGEPEATPFWRTLKAKGELNPKYPGGIPELTSRLQVEGHTVVQKGKRYFVQGYEKVLARL